DAAARAHGPLRRWSGDCRRSAAVAWPRHAVSRDPFHDRDDRGDSLHEDLAVPGHLATPVTASAANDWDLGGAARGAFRVGAAARLRIPLPRRSRSDLRGCAPGENRLLSPARSSDPRRCLMGERIPFQARTRLQWPRSALLLQRSGIDAIALAGRFRAVLENVPKVTAAAVAVHFDALHPVTGV